MTTEPTPSSEGLIRRNEIDRADAADLRPLLVNPERLSTLLGLSHSTIYELLATGEIPSFKVGRRRVIPLTAVEQWIERRLKEAEGGA